MISRPALCVCIAQALACLSLVSAAEFLETHKAFAGVRAVDFSYGDISLAGSEMEYDRALRFEAVMGYTVPQSKFFANQASVFIYSDARRAKPTGGQVEVDSYGLGMEGGVIWTFEFNGDMGLLFYPHLRGSVGYAQGDFSNWQDGEFAYSGDFSGFRADYGVGLDVIVMLERWQFDFGFGWGAWETEDADISNAGIIVDPDNPPDPETPVPAADSRLPVDGADHWVRIGVQYRF